LAYDKTTVYVGSQTISAAAPLDTVAVFARERVIIPHGDAADIQAKMSALTDLNDYKAARSLTDADLLAIGDINGDGKVTNADVEALIALVANNSRTGYDSLTAVSEPATLSLAVLGGAGGLVCVVDRWRSNRWKLSMRGRRIASDDRHADAAHS
jgi:hypothetical protein